MYRFTSLFRGDLDISGGISCLLVYVTTEFLFAFESGATSKCWVLPNQNLRPKFLVRGACPNFRRC